MNLNKRKTSEKQLLALKAGRKLRLELFQNKKNKNPSFIITKLDKPKIISFDT